MTKVAILGAGMAGLGASFSLKTEPVDAVLYEQRSRPGGHAMSHTISGFTYDEGGHVSFTKDNRIKELFASSVNDELYTVSANVNNYWKGRWIKHPAQCNLHNVPVDLKIDILADYFDARKNDYGKIENYQDWLYASFGKAFSDTFPMEYTKKYHTTTASNMSTEWVGPRLYRPDPREVLKGAFNSETDNVHYVQEVRYPRHGGFESFLRLFIEEAELRTNHKVTNIDPVSRRLQFSNKHIAEYDALVSSLPLPELISVISDVPEHVRAAAARLACTQCIIVNIGINRSNISEYHWTYFYDDDFTFTRLNFPHMQSPANAPSGAGIIQAEVYFSSKYKPVDKSPDEYITPVINDLIRCDLISENDEILFSDAKYLPYANVIFDLERASALEIIKEFTNEVGIYCCGRFGEWGYHWTDESFASGEKAAQKALDALR